jgi:hypothetical protein
VARLRGTESSNPAPSSAESIANLTLGSMHRLGGLNEIIQLEAVAGTTLRRKLMRWRRRFIALFVVSALTGCGTATGSRTSTPFTAPYGAGSTSSPQIGGPAVSANAGLSSPGVIGAGSFPRSFLIPGTDTSIRIGGS